MRRYRPFRARPLTATEIAALTAIAFAGTWIAADRAELAMLSRAGRAAIF